MQSTNQYNAHHAVSLFLTLNYHQLPDPKHILVCNVSVFPIMCNGSVKKADETGANTGALRISSVSALTIFLLVKTLR